MEVKKHMTHIQVKPVTHKHRKKYFHIIKIYCQYTSVGIVISPHGYKIIKSLLDLNHTFFIDKVYMQKLYYSFIKDVTRHNTSLMVNRISISECKKYRKDKNVLKYNFFHFENTYMNSTNMICLYVPFKTKSDYMKWKLKYD